MPTNSVEELSLRAFRLKAKFRRGIFVEKLEKLIPKKVFLKEKALMREKYIRSAISNYHESEV